MRKQIKGIALILLGILFNVAGVGLSCILPGEYPAIPCVIGLVIGLFGTAVVYTNKKSPD